MIYTDSQQSLQAFFDQLAPQRDMWISKNSYYYQELIKLHQWLIPPNQAVLDIGCGTGNLLVNIKPRVGEGIDFSHEMIKIAARKYPHLHFQVMDAHHLEYKKKFDYVILSNLVGYADDIWQVLRSLRQVCHTKTRIVITNYNYFWQPVLALAEKLHLKMPDRIQNWLPQEFIEHFLYLNGFEVVKKGKYLHLPFYIPYVSNLVNRVFAQLPFLSKVGLIEYLVCRPIFLKEIPVTPVGVSIIVPTHQEVGNIETIVERMPKIGRSTELIFVDLPGGDGTKDKIQQVIKSYEGPLQLKLLIQKKRTGKIGAVSEGIKEATGEIILIYDADITVPPADLFKFYLALVEGKGELINGTRLVYPTEKGALRFLNHIGNLGFAKLFTWALGQHLTDTLCGSKGFWSASWRIEFEKLNSAFAAKDRYGDFYLLLSAYLKNFRIAEVPVRYKTRKYGDTKLNRLKNGWQFLKLFLYFLWNYKILRKREF